MGDALGQRASRPAKQVYDAWDANLIGFEWVLPKHLVFLKDERLASVCALATLSDDAFITTPVGQYQHLIGKLIWTALHVDLCCRLCEGRSTECTR